MRAPLVMLLAAACAAAPEQEPMHHAIVCASDAEADCSPAERSAEFDRWTKLALRHPGSTFSVWLAQADGPPSALFKACVPERWGQNVMATKAAFLRDGRTRASEGGAALPAGCVLPEDAAGRVSILAGGRRRVLEQTVEAHHLAVVCDRSDSMLGTSCDAVALEAAFDGWLGRSGGLPGGSFTVFGVGTSRDGAAVLFRVAASTTTPGERTARLLAARHRLGASLRGSPAGSAIAEALDVVTDDLRARAGRKAVLVLSDLRQVTPGTWNFEAAAPEPAVFTAWLRSAGLFGGLRGVEVQACGLHHRRAPGARRFDAGLAHRVEQAWAGALQAAGAGGGAISASCPVAPGGEEGS